MTLALAGDVMLGRLVDEGLRTRPLDDPWRSIDALTAGADVFLYNLECAVCRDVPEWEPQRKVFHFRLDASRAATLLASRVDGVQLANNHVMDHDIDGLLETIRALDALGVPHAGAGRDLAAARAPAVLPSGVALVAASDHPREWAATQEAPGIFLVDPASEASRVDVALAIAAAREAGARIVVLGLHWGPNMRRIPPPTFRAFARAAIDAGATVVWGTSAHLFQGIERHGDGVILYDAGDFVDDYAIDPAERNDLSFLFLVDLDERARVERIRLRPTLILDHRVVPAPPDAAAWALARMRQLCAPMGTRVDVGGAAEAVVT